MKLKAGLAGIALALLAACSAEEPASSGPLPPMMVIAVGQPGSVLNAAGTGIAKLVTEETDTRMRVRVTSGMDALVGAGDAELGVSASDSAHLSSRGLRHYEGRPQKRLRLALPGPPLLLGFLVRESSTLRTLEDLKGARVSGEYPNARPMHFDGKTMLATVGMTWGDLDVVPVASFRDGMQALIDGRADAAIASVGSGLTQQADASLGGVRFLSLPREADLSDRMWSVEPGFHAVSVPAGFSVGVEEDLVLAGKEAYLTASADASPEAIHAIVALLWDDMDTLGSVHPLFRRWTRDEMTNARVTLPFHEGAVRFLKEAGVWTEAHEEAQRRLLDELSR